MPELNEAVIISAARTPVGKFLGALKGFTATQLGALVVRESVKWNSVRSVQNLQGCTNNCSSVISISRD